MRDTVVITPTNITFSRTTLTVTPHKIIAAAQAQNTGETYRTELLTSKHTLIADEPADIGGKDEGPAPGEYLCMSLASCKVITLRMYAQRKGWKVETIKVTVELVKGADMETGNNTFFSELSVSGDLTEEQRVRLLEISKACPLHKLLGKPSDLVSTLAT
jgi:putative redox protein